MSQWAAITVLGRDRSGIVAGITRVLFEHGCNLEDCSCVRLRDSFAMILVARLPDPPDLGALDAAIATAAATLGVGADLRDLGCDPPTPPPAGRTRSLVVYGADRPGIVYRVSERLAAVGCNVTDVATHIAGEVYLMLLEATVPDSVDDARLEAELARLRAELEVDITLRALEHETL